MSVITHRNLYKIDKRYNSMVKIDYKTFKYSVIILIILIIPFNAIHEIGHLIPCILSGGEGSFLIGLTSSQAICKGALSNSLVFAFAGGFLATIAGILPLTIKRIQRPYLVIPLLSLGVGHFIVAIIETFAREWYMSEIAMPIMTIMSFGLFVIFLVMFGRETRIRKDKWLTSTEANKMFESEKFG